MAENLALESAPMTQEPHRNQDSRGSGAHSFCHAKYTHVSQTLWRGLHLTLYVWQLRGKAAAEVLEWTVPYMVSDIRRDVEYILERTRPAQSYDGDVLVLFDRLESKHPSSLRSETAV
jgi:hypothetical protein